MLDGPTFGVKQIITVLVMRNKEKTEVKTRKINSSWISHTLCEKNPSIIERRAFEWNPQGARKKEGQGIHGGVQNTKKPPFGEKHGERYRYWQKIVQDDGALSMLFASDIGEIRKSLPISKIMEC